MTSYFTLDHQLKFYVPSTRNQSETLTPEEHGARVNEIAGLLSDYFGGASVETIQGYYKLNGKIIVENIQVVTSFATSDALKLHSSDFLNLALAKCAEWSQDSIGIEIDHVMQYVS